jgi:hypothetical protein
MGPFTNFLLGVISSPAFYIGAGVAWLILRRFSKNRSLYTGQKQLEMTGEEFCDLVDELQKFKASLAQERQLAMCSPEKLEKRLAVLVAIEEQLLIRLNVCEDEEWRGVEFNRRDWMLPYCQEKIEAIHKILESSTDEFNPRI